MYVHIIYIYKKKQKKLGHEYKYTITSNTGKGKEVAENVDRISKRKKAVEYVGNEQWWWRGREKRKREGKERV